MEHKIILNSVDLMLIVDAMDFVEKDGEFKEEDRKKAARIRKSIVDKVLKDFRERGENESDRISGKSI